MSKPKTNYSLNSKYLKSDFGSLQASTELKYILTFIIIIARLSKIILDIYVS